MTEPQIFAPASNNPQDVLIAALKNLGGIGHLREVSAECVHLGFPQPDPSIRRLFQQYSTDAVWTKSQKPANADDLFYSVEGVDRGSGFWGLRGFAVDNPQAYPIFGLKRAYAELLDRAKTPLFSVRGIAYRDSAVQAIQVSFSPDSPYPDRLLPDGRIEHIGEGRGVSQIPTAGNRGMLDALKDGSEIPVFQSVGPKGKKRYVYLGFYKVLSYNKRKLSLAGSSESTDAYVFLLQPMTVTSLRAAGSVAESNTMLERGGFEEPKLREIPDEPPSPSTTPSTSLDPEARRQALERRSVAHHALVLAFKHKAVAAGLTCVCDQYADALCDGSIFEMKSLEGDTIAQVRAAVGQLYHYMFIHRNLPGYRNPGLYAVFDGKIDSDLGAFLKSSANIGVISYNGVDFEADSEVRAARPWLFS